MWKERKVENIKGVFPYDFVNNKDIPLTYYDIIPSKNFYPTLTDEEYNYISDNKWNLRLESIKYCENDCRALHQVLINFNRLIYNKYNLNIHKFPPFLSFRLGSFPLL